MKTYVVKQGDYLARIAEREGLSADEIWSDPSNKELADLRKSPQVLKPGDILHLPEPSAKKLRFAQGGNSNFKAPLAPLSVPMTFTRRGKPLANKDYEVDGLGALVKGTTDGNGVAKLTVTSVVERVTVRFPTEKTAFRVNLGHLDPASEPSGAVQRLATLGYLLAPPRGSLKDHGPSARSTDAEQARLNSAIRRFQTDNGLAETGELDAATSDALIKAHGV